MKSFVLFQDFKAKVNFYDVVKHYIIAVSKLEQLSWSKEQVHKAKILNTPTQWCISYLCSQMHL